jgi:probable F420-dependent oxidoreductase
MFRRGRVRAAGARRLRWPSFLLLPLGVAVVLAVGTLTIRTDAPSPHSPGRGRPAAHVLAPGEGRTRRFRFIAPMPKLNQPVAAWRDAVRRIEDLGFSTVSISDHFTQGWVVEPTVAMSVAAELTERLRVLSLVLGNDYRHPVLVHKAMATLDVLSEGRVEIGLGAGWLRSDYQAARIPYDPPGVRVERLDESVQILKGLFAASPFDFTGRHYGITRLDGLPKPVQRPHPLLLVGGGGRRVLSIAGRHADIAGINPSLDAGIVTPAAVLDMTPERVAQKLAWVREAAVACGRPVDDLEVQMSLLVCRVSTSAGKADEAVSSLASQASVDQATLQRSPAVLSGSLQQCVERLQELRECFGVSYLHLGGNVEAAAPVVQRLAGT